MFLRAFVEATHPFFALEIAARCSGVCFLPSFASRIFAFVSAVCLVPRFITFLVVS
jgi:hypothetical protein